MRAVRFHEHGGAEVLRYESAADPELRPGWVLVRVRACALNHLDIWQRVGLDRVTIPMPHISGADVAGEVAAVGEGVTHARVGDRVMLQPGLSCGRCAKCLAGEDNFCRQYDVLGYQSAGGYAELVTVPAANVIGIPDRIDFVTAAAFPLAFLTAWHMLMTRARLTERDTVLVIAAGSGVGQAAVQIARFFQARVFATAGGETKLERARSLGAEAVIDHYQEDVVRRVKALTDGRGVDVVIEAGFKDGGIKFLEQIRGVTVDRRPIDFHNGNAFIDPIFNHFSLCHGLISSCVIFLDSFGFTVKEYLRQRHTESAEIGVFFIKNSLLRALRASALKPVADPSFGGSAVQPPSPASQEGLKIQFLIHLTG